MHVVRVWHLFSLLHEVVFAESCSMRDRAPTLLRRLAQGKLRRRPSTIHIFLNDCYVLTGQQSKARCAGRYNGARAFFVTPEESTWRARRPFEASVSPEMKRQRS